MLYRRPSPAVGESSRGRETVVDIYSEDVGFTLPHIEKGLILCIGFDT